MSADQFLRDLREVRQGCDLGIAEFIQEAEDAENEFCKNLASSCASDDNLEAILCAYNPAFNILKHYGTKEYNLKSIPQPKLWWKTDNPDTAAIVCALDKIGLENPHKFLNFVRKQKLAFITFQKEFGKIEPKFRTDLNDERILRGSLNILADQFNPVWTHLENMQIECSAKAGTLVEDISDRIHQLKQQWLNPNAEQNTYLCSLDKIVDAVNVILTSVTACKTILNEEPDRFVRGSEFCVRYSGQRRTVPKSDMFPRMEKFRSSLLSLKNDLENKNVDFKNNETEMIVKGAQKFVSEAIRVAELIQKLSLTLNKLFLRLVTRINYVHDEKVRVEKVLPLYKSDENAYINFYYINITVLDTLKGNNSMIEEHRQKFDSLIQPLDNDEDSVQDASKNIVSTD